MSDKNGKMSNENSMLPDTVSDELTKDNVRPARGCLCKTDL